MNTSPATDSKFGEVLSIKEHQTKKVRFPMNNSSPYGDLYNWSVTDPISFGKRKRKQSIGRLLSIRSAILPIRHSHDGLSEAKQIYVITLSIAILRPARISRRFFSTHPSWGQKRLSLIGNFITR